MKTNIDGGYLISEKAGSGIPILFIHGYPLSRKIWDPQIDALSNQATIITIDLRGHGESFEFDGAYSMDLLAEDCVKILNEQGIASPLVVCGLSMGGYITLALYRNHPELFKGMILTSTKASADSVEAKANRDASIKSAIEQGVVPIADNMTQKLFAEVTFKSNPQLTQSIHDLMARTSTLGIIGALQGMRDRIDSTPLLPQIKCPVLVIHGVDDQIIPLKEAELMSQQIPNSNLVKIDNAGHLVNLEQPAKYNQAVGEFLSSLV